MFYTAKSIPTSHPHGSVDDEQRRREPEELLERLLGERLHSVFRRRIRRARPERAERIDDAGARVLQLAFS